MRALSATDHVFLFLESRKQPMNVGGLCVFELPEDAPDDFLHQLLIQFKESLIKPTFPFNQLLHKRAFWQTDDEFDLAHHVHHIALPKPAGIKELCEYISCEHARLMDKNSPLWEMHLIDGIAPAHDGAPRRFAVWLKVHHATMDGISAMRLLQLSLSTDPTARIAMPFWALPNLGNVDELAPAQKSAFTALKEQFTSVYPVGREVLKNLHERWQGNTHVVSTFDAPQSMLNQPISSARTWLAHSFVKTRFSSIAKALDATTNDIILAVCAGALRQYLIRQDALPTKPLIAFVPISLRRDGSIVGNQISFLLTNLGTHKSTPQARLAVIKSSINDGKNRFGRLTQPQILNYSALNYAWAGINLATGALPKHQAFNLIISNVPTENAPLYLNGAKLTNIYPASVLFDGQTLNMTLVNHRNTIDFGITACPSALPDIETLLGFMEEELVAFEDVVATLGEDNLG